jgi:hypothetical protein
MLADMWREAPSGAYKQQVNEQNDVVDFTAHRFEPSQICINNKPVPFDRQARGHNDQETLFFGMHVCVCVCVYPPSATTLLHIELRAACGPTLRPHVQLGHLP